MTVYSNQPIAYIRSSAELGEHELEPLLVLAASTGVALRAPITPILKQGLMAKVQQAKASASDKFTVRQKTLDARKLGPGVTEKTLYKTTHSATRPGEPTHARVLNFSANSKITGLEIFSEPQSFGDDLQTEFLVLSGSLTLVNQTLASQSLCSQALALRDYQIMPAGAQIHELRSEFGAKLYIRQSKVNPINPPTEILTVKDSADNWPDYAPGIKRRVLWHSNGLAAMLYLTQPHANVPLHSHLHDEECLMVQGELYLDDTLLLEGDYQLATAGSRHQITQTETGVVLFAHGDVDLAFE
jgi:quercetin dioxygenase-like cupin family protein